MRGQRLAVLNELKAGNEVTSMTMWRKYGITRLSGIIYDLKGMGYHIITVMIECTTRFSEKTQCAKYVLVTDEEE